MKKIITLSLSIAFLTNSFAQKHVGINTTNPLAALHVADSSVLFTGPATLPVTATPPPVSGAGNRMFWYADNAAFRAGGVGGTQWDKASIGQYSFAVGLDSKASQYATTALGNNCLAAANFATAMGRNTISSAAVSTAMGFNTTASNTASTAMGNSTTASGLYSTAMGNSTSASGSASTAIGNSTNAAGINSFAAGTTNIAFGINTIAAGDNSNAVGGNSFSIGHYARAIGDKSFALGDSVRANGYAATAMGYQAIANGDKSFALGDSVVTDGDASFAVGSKSWTWGTNAIALGYNTIAAGDQSTAMGYSTIAYGSSSTAMGLFSTAFGYNATSMGYTSAAQGNYSIAMGYRDTASAQNTVAMGMYTKASGIQSTAMGSFTDASGAVSTAMGFYTVASGDFSTAMGNLVSTNGHSGSLIIGDHSGALSTTKCFHDDEFRARMNGGYALYTNTATTTGVFMNSGDNAWSSISDSTKKEKFKKTDGEYVLNSIGKMKLGSWNYKSQNAKQYRHYGAMAQEFYKAFGNDGIGKIGCDTLINSADIDGVMMIGLQALEKRSSVIIKENAELKADNLALQKEIAGIKEQYTTTNVQLTDKIAMLETRLNQLMAIKEQKDASKEIVINK
jgi:hypothetical protein